MRKLDELLQVLDELVEVLSEKRSRMERVIELVQEADMDGLEELLRTHGQAAPRHAEVQRRLDGLRRSIAEECGTRPEDLTLDRLAADAEDSEAIALNERRERLAVLVEQVQEHSRTATVLLRHALELNGRMLAALNGGQERNTVYSADGEVQRESATTTSIRHCI